MPAVWSCQVPKLTEPAPLQATHKNGKEAGIEIVDPPSGSKPGDRVYFEGPYESKGCFSLDQ